MLSQAGRGDDRTVDSLTTKGVDVSVELVRGLVGIAQQGGPTMGQAGVLHN